MYLSTLTLSHFRCHSDERQFTLSEGITLIRGENAKGKTTLLEAVHLISRGKGFREEEEIELLTFGAEHGFVNGMYVRGSSMQESTVTYRKIQETLEKKYILEKSPVGLLRYRREQIPVVLFAPHQLDIIMHGPSYRREYLDSCITLVDPVYAKALREYSVALRKRNALLETYESLLQLKQDIAFWDEYLVERSTIITQTRQRFIDHLNEFQDFAGKTFRIEYIRNEMTYEKLSQKFDTESVAHRTLIGPQKDDIVIYLKQDETCINVHLYASRSQQRLSLLWMKMRELSYLHEKMHTKPILLLDDMYSEFDSANKHIIASLLPLYQTLITTTDETNLPPEVVRIDEEIRL